MLYTAHPVGIKGCMAYWKYSLADFCRVCAMAFAVATVAQLDRALASEAEGCWFDPSQSHQCPREIGAPMFAEVC